MTADIKFKLEFLRPVEHICEPDPRQYHFVLMDQESKSFRPITIDDYHAAVSKVNLNMTVPEKIVIHFEIAKNLYLYAWFIYRFYPVAEHHAFACLEFALRTRYKNEIPKKYFQRSKEPGLRSLMRYAIDSGHIKNTGFQEWHETVEQRAQYRYAQEKFDEMREKGLSQMDIDYSKAEITDVDKNLNYVQILLDTLPYLRNHYAHGTPILKNDVLSTIKIVSEIINQIYPEK